MDYIKQRKYRQGIESEGYESNSNRDSNPDMNRRDWIKAVIGAGVIGVIYAGTRKAIEYNPRAIEKLCNGILKIFGRNNAPEIIENPKLF